ncbi:MAG: hypothetical protein IKO73_00905 [Bacteroidaceae bacterium]|nr:hypothetical protein [Bacteroidaceae bacterium]
MKNKDIEQLINKYLEGETSPAEEQKLALELQRPDIPEEWQAIRLMLGELALGEAEYDTILRKNTPLHHGRGWGWICSITSMAAVLLVGLFLYQHMPNENVNEAPHYYTYNFSAGSTLKNVYTSRQHKEKILSYTQFKTMLYENK